MSPNFGNNHQTFYSLLRFHFPVAVELFYKTTQDISTINPNDIRVERPLKRTVYSYSEKKSIRFHQICSNQLPFRYTNFLVYHFYIAILKYFNFMYKMYIVISKIDFHRNQRLCGYHIIHYYFNMLKR